MYPGDAMGLAVSSSGRSLAGPDRCAAAVKKSQEDQQRQHRLRTLARAVHGRWSGTAPHQAGVVRSGWAGPQSLARFMTPLSEIVDFAGRCSQTRARRRGVNHLADPGSGEPKTTGSAADRRYSISSANCTSCGPGRDAQGRVYRRAPAGGAIARNQAAAVPYVAEQTASSNRIRSPGALAVRRQRKIRRKKEAGDFSARYGDSRGNLPQDLARRSHGLIAMRDLARDRTKHSPERATSSSFWNKTRMRKNP